MVLTPAGAAIAPNGKPTHSAAKSKNLPGINAFNAMLTAAHVHGTHAQRLNRSAQAEHARQGWGGMSLSPLPQEGRLAQEAHGACT